MTELMKGKNNKIPQKVISKLPNEVLPDDKSGYVRVYNPTFDMYSYGKTKKEAFKNLSESILILMDTLNQRGQFPFVIKPFEKGFVAFYEPLNLATQGDTKEEAKTMFNEMLDIFLQDLRESGNSADLLEDDMEIVETITTEQELKDYFVNNGLLQA